MWGQLRLIRPLTKLSGLNILVQERSLKYMKKVGGAKKNMTRIIFAV